MDHGTAGGNNEGMTVEVKELPRWSRDRFLAGRTTTSSTSPCFGGADCGSAWGCMETAYQAEGDFEPWLQFFRHARLHPMDALIGGWRFHPDSLSHGDEVRYDLNCEEILENELGRKEGHAGLKSFRRWIGRSGACRSCEESGNGWWSTICADVFTGCQVRIGRR